MPNTRLCTALLMTAVLFTMPLARAEIYQWVDANGITHFSDKPRKSGPSKVIRKAKVVKKTVRKKAVPKRQASPPAKQVRRVAKPSRVAKPARVARPVRARKPVRVPKPIRIKKPVKATKPLQVKPLQAKKKQRLKEQRVKKVDRAAALYASLNATFYDLDVAPPETEALEPQKAQPKMITNVKQSLCTDKRMALAALQEKGFESYYDEKGEHRIAWGIEGFYRSKRRYLTPDEIAKQTKHVLFEVEQYCDTPHDQQQQKQARADWIRAEYCEVSRVILEDLKHPFMRTSEREIQDQAIEVDRFCSEHHSDNYRDDERYFPKTLQVKKLQQKHFFYR